MKKKSTFYSHSRIIKTETSFETTKLYSYTVYLRGLNEVLKKFDSIDTDR